MDRESHSSLPFGSVFQGEQFQVFGLRQQHTIHLSQVVSRNIDRSEMRSLENYWRNVIHSKHVIMAEKRNKEGLTSIMFQMKVKQRRETVLRGTV